MEMRNYFSIGVFKVFIFNTEGKLLVNLNGLTESNIYEEDKITYLSINSALISDELLSLLYKKEKNGLSDYEQMLKGTNTKEKKVYTLNNKPYNNIYKIIVIGQLGKGCPEDISITSISKYDIPKAQLVQRPNHNSSSIKINDFDLKFQLLPFNEDGDFARLIIEDK